jgi:exodeoxyribonuclease V gamma subunit
VFNDMSGAIPDEEPFELDGLASYGLLQDIVVSLSAYPDEGETADASRIAQRLAHIQRAGRLPLGLQAQRLCHQNQHELLHILRAWRTAVAQHPHAAVRHRLHLTSSSGVTLDDWLDPLHQASADTAAPVWLMLTASKWANQKGEVRTEKLLAAWLMYLAAWAHNVPLSMRLVGRDGCVHIAPPPLPLDNRICTQAQQQLDALLNAYHQGQAHPLPLPLKTALAWVKKAAAASNDDEAAREQATQLYDGGHERHRGIPAEADDPYWQRLWPDADALFDTTAFADLATRLYSPFHAWANSPAVQFHAYESASAAKKGAIAE